MVAWAACDPAAAGEWLNAHKSSRHFAAFARAYAVQIAVDDPAAARQWAALVGAAPRRPINLMEMGQYGPIEHTIRAVEHMMSGSSPADNPAPAKGLMVPGANGVRGAPLLDEYVPVLVRIAAGTEPVIMMKPLDPLACHPCHQGTWQVPAQVMVIDTNGMLCPESTMAAAGSR